MKITFPHMGSLFLSMKSLFLSLGHEVVPPPPISQKTIELGTKHSPEFACFPLKINLGNFIEAFDKGADTVVMLGGIGPCRFGYYAEVQRRVLQSLGYDFDMIVVEPPRGDFDKMLAELSKLRNNNSWSKIIKSLYLTLYKIKLLDDIDKKTKEVRPQTDRFSELDDIENHFKNELVMLNNKRKLDNLFDETVSGLDKLTNQDNQPIKVALVGEIYMVLENTANMEIEKFLGEQRIKVERGIYLSDWIKDHVFWGSIGVNKNQNVIKAAEPYIKRFVGGHGQESVGEAVLKVRQGCDGVIHLFPFTCTPEIIAQSVMPKAAKDYDFPLLTVIIDEHKGFEGLRTRLEAFCDLLKRKKSSEVNTVYRDYSNLAQR